MVQVVIKWNKLTYNTELDTSQSVSTFKTKLQELTGVPVDRQKLMAKGAWVGTLKDDADFSKMQLKEGHQVMLMGTADVVVMPKEAVVFIEDMTAEEKAEKGVVLSAGLKNMGNTCYMNSTVQCFRHMKEVREALVPVRPASVGTSFASFLRDTFVSLDSSVEAIFPMQLVSSLRTNFPQFDQRGQNGHHMQQDAEELLNVLAQSIKEGLTAVEKDYDGLLGVAIEEQQSCQETPDEPQVRKTDRLTKLICNIEGTIGRQGSSSIDHLQDGLKLGLEGTVEKHSEVLGRNAVWQRKLRVASLPKYLCIQFMRFFWKATPESADHAGVKCKILRKVSYPETLDIYEMCSETVQAALRANREREDKLMEQELAAKRAKTESGDAVSSAGEASSSASASASATETVFKAAAPAEEAAAMDVDDEDAAALAAALAMSVGAPVPASASSSAAGSSSGPSPFGTGVSAEFTGMYELHSLVTHKGRSADSGHYIGWTRQAPGSSFWWKYDDDLVSEVRTEDIMKLDGGGDRDMAYLVFYRAKDGKGK
jgi:ubiquitin carboxyl-terminal hydrolase 14